MKAKIKRNLARKNNGQRYWNARRIIIIAFLFFLLFLFFGALLPYLGSQEVSEEIMKSHSYKDFYNDSGSYSVDYAAIVEDSQGALETRFHILEQAQERILFSTYGINNDRSAMEVCSALYAAAQRGVKVEIIVDAMFCGSGMRRGGAYYLLGSMPNVEIKMYNPINILRPWELNGRLHDKFMLVDDKVLLLGGRNTNDLFIGEYADVGANYDREILIYNSAHDDPANRESAVFQLEEYFYSLWASPYCRTYFDTIPQNKAGLAEEAAAKLDAIYAEYRETRPELFSKIEDFESFAAPTRKVTLIYNPISPQVKEPWVFWRLSELMRNADSRVLIQSPYAVLDKDMRKSLAEIAEKVPDCSLLINSVAVGENLVASSDYTFNRGRVISTGFEVYEFFGDLSAHNKALLIDDDIAVIGSYNLDCRSTYIDTEVMIVVHGEEFAALLDANINEMRAKALHVLADGSYEDNPDVEEIPIPTAKKWLTRIFSVLIQPLRKLV